MKEKNVAWILALFLWWLGIHKFYLWNWIIGFIYLLFCWTRVPCVLWIIEAIMIFMMDDEEFDIKYNWKEPTKEKKKNKRQLEKEKEEDNIIRRYFLIWMWVLLIIMICVFIYMWIFAEHKTF